MPEFRVINSLHDIEKRQWGVCFPGEVENYDYLLAIEESALAGFSFCYLTAWQGSTLQSGTPMFVTDYSLDTTLQGVGRKLTSRIKNAFPKLLTTKLACLGSPCTEQGEPRQASLVVNSFGNAFLIRLVSFLPTPCKVVSKL